MTPAARITPFYDATTGTVSYVVADLATQQAAVIDSVLDFDPKSGRTSTGSADAIARHLRAEGLAVQWILETHAHADHLSAAPYLKARLGGRIAIGAHIREVQKTFAPLFDFGPDFAADGSDFDHLFEDGETFPIGSIEATAWRVPGHTPADMAYLIAGPEPAAFVGDTLFMPDLGSARADFPGGDARQLYRSMRHLLSLPPSTRLFLCHDYPPPGRNAQWETTVAEQRARNIHVRDDIDEDSFVQMRQARDATLGVPTLMLPAIQVNVRAGHLPPAAPNGVVYLRLPLNALPLKS